MITENVADLVCMGLNFIQDRSTEEKNFVFALWGSLSEDRHKEGPKLHFRVTLALAAANRNALY